MIRKGYTISLILILAIIGIACGVFYLMNDSSEYVSFSPENDGLHLECVNICGNVAGQQVCYPRCQYVFGEAPDRCDPLGSVCLVP